jgi:hypothetical protein
MVTGSHWDSMHRALGALGTRLPEMREDLSCYAAVQADRARLAASHVGTRAVSSILQVVAVAAIFATSASLLLLGIAGGLASVLRGNIWLANPITGSSALIALGSVIAITIASRKRARLRELQDRYRAYEARSRATTDAGIVPEGSDNAQ